MIKTALVFRGHLIDSLTLAKIIDHIQELGGDYHLNHLGIGGLKKEISSVSLTLLATDEDQLQRLLADLAPYGPLSPQDEIVETAPCEAPGKPPEGAFLLSSPLQLFSTEGALSVEATPWAITVNPHSKSAQLLEIDKLKPGDSVVIGTAGLAW